jgi:hypothetical protein
MIANLLIELDKCQSQQSNLRPPGTIAKDDLLSQTTDGPVGCSDASSSFTGTSQDCPWRFELSVRLYKWWDAWKRNKSDTKLTSFLKWLQSAENFESDGRFSVELNPYQLPDESESNLRGKLSFIWQQQRNIWTSEWTGLDRKGKDRVEPEEMGIFLSFVDPTDRDSNDLVVVQGESFYVAYKPTECNRFKVKKSPPPSPDGQPELPAAAPGTGVRTAGQQSKKSEAQTQAPGTRVGVQHLVVQAPSHASIVQSTAQPLSPADVVALKLQVDELPDQKTRAFFHRRFANIERTKRDGTDTAQSLLQLQEEILKRILSMAQ